MEKCLIPDLGKGKFKMSLENLEVSKSERKTRERREMRRGESRGAGGGKV